MSQAILVVLAICCALVFAASDAVRYALHHVPRVRLRQWASSAQEEGRQVRWFQHDKRRFSIVTATVLQGSIVLGLLATVRALSQTMEAAAAFAVSIGLWATLVLIWKTVLAAMTEEAAESLLRRMTPVLALIWIVGFVVFLPIRFVSSWREKKIEEEDDDEVTAEEVSAYIDVGEEEGILEPDDRLLVSSVVAFGDLTVREVMTPRVDIVWVDADDTFDDLVALHHRSNHTRITVYEGDADHVLGFVHLKDVFAALATGARPSIREVTRPAFLISEGKEIAELLREFQAEQQQIAVVVDEFGGTAGLVSIEDLLEEIVGEIVDEHEGPGQRPVIELGDGSFLVNGLMRLDQIEALTGTKLEREDDDFETVAGLIFKECGKVPLAGESVERGGLMFIADRVDRKRIYRVKVSRPVDQKDGMDQE